MGSEMCIRDRTSGEHTAVSPGLARMVESASQAGVEVVADAVDGSAFWQTQEIEEAPALIERSLAELRRFV